MKNMIQRVQKMNNPKTSLLDLTQKMYGEVSELMHDNEMSTVVQHGLNVMYGPPMINPDVALITFQGGGADTTIQKSPPSQLLYRNDPYKFGTALRKYMAVAGLSETLNNRTVAQSVIFPQAPTSQAASWMSKAGPKARWRIFSKEWTERLLDAQKPKAILVFGDKASNVIGIEWRDVERRHKQNHMTFARADWRGIPVVFCHHLSIGCPADEAVRCMQEVKATIERS